MSKNRDNSLFRIIYNYLENSLLDSNIHNKKDQEKVNEEILPILLLINDSKLSRKQKKLMHNWERKAERNSVTGYSVLEARRHEFPTKFKKTLTQNLKNFLDRMETAIAEPEKNQKFLEDNHLRFIQYFDWVLESDEGSSGILARQMENINAKLSRMILG